MKKIVWLLIGMLISTQTLFAAAIISFKETSHDFGNIKEEVGEAQCLFSFTNKGTSPLLIYKALASCGCTTPEFSKEPIAPGATSTVKVSYQTADRPGSFHKTITLYTNDPEAPNVVLIISGSVIPSGNNPESTYPRNLQGLRLDRTSVNMLETKVGSIKTEIIEMLNSTQKTLNIRFHKVPKHMRVYASNTMLKPGQTGLITIKYFAEVAKDYGKREDQFYVFTSEKDKENPNNMIYVSATITEDFSRLSATQLENAPSCAFSDSRINFGKMTKGTVKTSNITVTNKGKTNLILRKIATEYDGIGFTPSSRIIAPGKTANIKLTFNAGRFNGSVVQRVTIYTNDPKSSVNRIFLTAQVSE
jgi:hypothetical protein